MGAEGRVVGARIDLPSPVRCVFAACPPAAVAAFPRGRRAARDEGYQSINAHSQGHVRESPTTTGNGRKINRLIIWMACSPCRGRPSFILEGSTAYGPLTQCPGQSFLRGYAKIERQSTAIAENIMQ